MQLINPYLLAAVAGVTWNPADKDAAITLSSGNLVATLTTGNGAFHAVRATVAHDVTDSAGYYFEVTSNLSATDDIVPGIGLAAASLTYPGDSGSNSVGYYNRNGQILFNGAGSSYGSAAGVNTTIGVAIRNGKVYFSRQGVYQGSGDPVAETNPARSGLTGMVLPMLGFFTSTDRCTGRFKTADFLYGPPSGYSQWDAP